MSQEEINKKLFYAAFSLAKRKADAGTVDPSSQCFLAEIYESGLEDFGIAKNLLEAVRLYQLAADQENPMAQNNLGNSYARGEGVKKDLKEAVRFYQLAAAQGNPLAQNNLGTCYARGEGIEKNLNEAVRFYRLSVQQGDVRSPKQSRKLLC